jgi:DNA-binding response OmpR family regulator
MKDRINYPVNRAGSRVSDNLAILFLTTDIKLTRDLQDRTKSFMAQVVFLACSNSAKIAELQKKQAIDAVLVDDAIIDPLNATLVSNLRGLTAGSGVNRPVFLLSSERDTRSLKKIIANGFTDIFTKPIDPSLFFQKLQIHLSRVRFLRDNLLFTMKVNSNLDLGLSCKLVAASEYGVTLHLNYELHPGEVYSLHCKMFGEQSGECLGLVTNCAPQQSEGGKYEAALIFVAPTRETMSVVRLWIKQEYIRSRGEEH